MNAMITRRLVFVYADDGLTTLAVRHYYSRGYIESRSRKNRKRVIPVIFAQLPGATEPEWIPVAVERESRNEQRHITQQLQGRHTIVLPDVVWATLGS